MGDTALTLVAEDMEALRKSHPLMRFWAGSGPQAVFLLLQPPQWLLFCKGETLPFNDGQAWQGLLSSSRCWEQGGWWVVN